MKNSGNAIPRKYDFSLSVAPKKSIEIEIASIGLG